MVKKFQLNTIQLENSYASYKFLRQDNIIDSDIIFHLYVVKRIKLTLVGLN